ncbi:MAG: flagellar biosynthesis protein FlhB [Paracoccaceae bacterium]
MSAQDTDQSEKSFDPTPEKLRQAREKGDVAKSADLSVAASYIGLLVVFAALGSTSLVSLGSGLMVLIDRPDMLSAEVFDLSSQVRLRGTILHSVQSTLPWFLVPALAVILSIFAQRAFVFAPSKLKPKLSKISPIANAKQKFGRNGLFEFSKSFAKLLLFSAGLALFFNNNLEEILALSSMDAAVSVSRLGSLTMRFMGQAVIIALAIGGIDAVWPYFELRRRNMMTRQEILDETKSSEGDPHLKQTRRQRGQEIARNQMIADVPSADVIVVNPTHYAVALKWSRAPGSAPVCVAKGVDETAARIRETAIEAGVPIHRDPPTARALYATVHIGSEIDEAQYAAVAIAIQFADQMRQKAKGRVT